MHAVDLYQEVFDCLVFVLEAAVEDLELGLGLLLFLFEAEGTLLPLDQVLVVLDQNVLVSSVADQKVHVQLIESNVSLVSQANERASIELLRLAVVGFLRLYLGVLRFHEVQSLENE